MKEQTRRISKSQALSYNVRRGQIPQLSLETYHKLQQGETVEVPAKVAEWLIERKYAVEAKGE